MDKFKNREEMEEFIDNNSYHVAQEVDRCDQCNRKLFDCSDDLEYIIISDGDYHGYKFCNDECLIYFLEDNVGVEEDE
jgi:uncharacterized protein with PIN domain